MASSEDEFEIECEEIFLSDSEDLDPLEVNRPTEPEKQSTSAEDMLKDDKVSKLVPLRGMTLNMLPDATKLKYIRRPTRPVRLFSFIERDLVNRFSKTTEASKPLALRLLDIVKTVNARRPVKVDNDRVVPNFYLMAAQCEPKEGEKVTKLDSMDIVNLVKDIIHMIKIGIYRHVDFVDIICDSPAIFLIKYINVKHWDPKMNAVYVVTSEYLLPYLCKIRAAEEEEEKASKRIKKSMWQRDERYQKKVPAKRKLVKKPDAVEPQTKKPLKGEPSKAKPQSTSVTLVHKGKIVKSGSESTNTATSSEQSSSNTSADPKTDVDTAKTILEKYLEPDAVQFFAIQMKLSGKKVNYYRWSDEDKMFALNLLRNNPTEYSLLCDKYSLPSEKSLEKFMEKVKQDKGLGQLVRRSTRKR